VIGVAAERLLSRTEWALLYLTGALVGHGVGEVFQPGQSGTSVAFAGILGGIAAKVLLDRDPGRRLWRIRFAVLMPLAILDTVLRDIHGLPFLAGLAVGTVFELRRTPLNASWRGPRSPRHVRQGHQQPRSTNAAEGAGRP
jgi:hypothetical protein